MRVNSVGCGTRGRWAALALATALAIAAGPAGATSFSFGDIDASDVIDSISLAADSGSGTTIDYTTSDDRLVIEASVAGIEFANKPDITGIPTGDVVFKAELTRTAAPFYLPFGSPFPDRVFASFDNGAVDWEIWDFGGTVPVLVLSADFTSTLDMSANENFLLQGELSGDYDIVGGDSDAQSAFGSQGDINASLNFGVTTVCATLADGCPFPTDFQDWSANPTMTLRPLAAPEAGTAILLGTALAGLGMASGRRRRR